MYNPNYNIINTDYNIINFNDYFGMKIVSEKIIEKKTIEKKIIPEKTIEKETIPKKTIEKEIIEIEEIDDYPYQTRILPDDSDYVIESI